MKKLLLAISSVSLIGLAWLLIQMENQTKCFQSIGVDAIAVFASDEASRPVKVLPVCPSYQWMPWGAETKNLEIPLHKALAAYDRLIEVTRQEVAPIEIRIVRQPEMQYALEHRRVILGEKVAQAEGQIFKALVSQWLLQINSDLLHRKLQLEVLGDFFFSAILGGVEIANPLNGSVTDLGPILKIENYNLSFRDLCRSPWAPGSQLALCYSLERITSTKVFRDGNFKAIVEAVDRTMRHWSYYSLRPVFDYLLWKSYLKADLTERLSILRTLAANLHSQVPSWHGWEDDNEPPQEEKEKRVFADTEKMIEFWQKEI